MYYLYTDVMSMCFQKRSSVINSIYSEQLFFCTASMY